jgi:hypothetical protein
VGKFLDEQDALKGEQLPFEHQETRAIQIRKIGITLVFEEESASPASQSSPAPPATQPVRSVQGNAATQSSQPNRSFRSPARNTRSSQQAVGSGGVTKTSVTPHSTPDNILFFPQREEDTLVRDIFNGQLCDNVFDAINSTRQTVEQSLPKLKHVLSANNL